MLERSQNGTEDVKSLCCEGGMMFLNEQVDNTQEVNGEYNEVDEKHEVHKRKNDDDSVDDDDEI